MILLRFEGFTKDKMHINMEKRWPNFISDNK